MLRNPFSAQTGSLQLFLSFHLLLVQSLRSASSENLGSCQFFPEYVHSPVLCICIDFQILRNMSEIFRILNGHLIFHLFLLRFFVSLQKFAQIFIAASGSCYVKQLSLIVFDKCLHGRCCSQEKALRSSKYKPC